MMTSDDIRDLVFEDELPDKFNRYRIVQLEGNYNMITEAREAANESSLSMEDYRFIINNFSRLYRDWEACINKKLG